MHFLAYILLRFWIGLLAICPFVLLAPLSDLLSFVLFKVIRYRRKVIRANLQFCFPEKTKDERKEIENMFFRNFTDVSLESLKAYSLSQAELNKRYKFINKEVLQKAKVSHQTALFLAAHFNNWEWATMTTGIQLGVEASSLYKPLSNKFIDNYVKKARQKHDARLVGDFKELLNTYRERNKKKMMITGFLADQYPAQTKRKVALDFFGKKISFHSSAYDLKESLFDCSYFFHTRRVKRFHYEVSLIELEHKADRQKYLQAYATALEKMIKEQPESWLWSHKRFKDQQIYK